jgi:hypothetical protein
MVDKFCKEDKCERSTRRMQEEWEVVKVVQDTSTTELISRQMLYL